jgi:hypothetical protein
MRDCSISGAGTGVGTNVLYEVGVLNGMVSPGDDVATGDVRAGD